MTTATPPLAPAPLTPAVSPAPAELPRWKRRLFYAIMLVVVWGILELVASAYLRVTQGYDGKHLYQFDFDPYKNILPARNYVDTRGVHHNSQGFRHATDVPLVKPPGTIRIFLMGASAAYGTGGLWPHIQRDYAVLQDSQTIDRYLERDLQAQFPGRKVEVINAAITSTWTHHHLIYLNQTILRFDPDMVLFLDGFNDFFFYEKGHDQFGSYTYNVPALRVLGEPTLKSLIYANAWWLFRRDPLAHVVSRAVSNAQLAFSERPDRSPMNVDSAMAGLERNFPQNALKMDRRIGLILRDEGVDAVFMQQPMLVLERGRKPMPEVERKLFEFNVQSYRPGYEAYSHRATQFTAAREQAMASDVGAQFIDLTKIYAGIPWQVYTDYVHLTPRANEVLADTVAHRVLPLLQARVAKQCAAQPGAPGCAAPAPVVAKKG